MFLCGPGTCNSPFQTQTGTGKDHVSEVVRDGRERILLGHLPDASQLTLGLFSVVGADEFDAAEDVEVSPVGAIGSVAVVGTNQGVEGTLLVDIHVLERIMGPRHIGSVRSTRAKIGHLDWSIALNAEEPKRLQASTDALGSRIKGLGRVGMPLEDQGRGVDRDEAWHTMQAKLDKAWAWAYIPGQPRKH